MTNDLQEFEPEVRAKIMSLRNELTQMFQRLARKQGVNRFNDLSERQIGRISKQDRREIVSASYRIDSEILLLMGLPPSESANPAAAALLPASNLPPAHSID
jgi:hypothetical protein